MGEAEDWHAAATAEVRSRLIADGAIDDSIASRGVEAALRELFAAVLPLVEGDIVSAFSSAWEICTYERMPDGSLADGEKMYERLKAAYLTALRALSLPAL